MRWLKDMSLFKQLKERINDSNVNKAKTQRWVNRRASPVLTGKLGRNHELTRVAFILHPRGDSGECKEDQLQPTTSSNTTGEKMKNPVHFAAVFSLPLKMVEPGFFVGVAYRVWICSHPMTWAVPAQFIHDTDLEHPRRSPPTSSPSLPSIPPALNTASLFSWSLPAKLC